MSDMMTTLVLDDKQSNSWLKSLDKESLDKLEARLSEPNFMQNSKYKRHKQCCSETLQQICIIKAGLNS